MSIFSCVSVSLSPFRCSPVSHRLACPQPGLLPPPHGLNTAGTEVRLALFLIPASWTGDRLDVFSLFFVDFETVELRQLVAGVLTQDSDVSACGRRTSNPPVSLFEVCLGQTFAGVEARVTLAEVRQRHWLVHVGPVGRVLEYLREHPIADTPGFAQFRPQRRFAVRRRRVFVGSVSHIWDARN